MLDFTVVTDTEVHQQAVSLAREFVEQHAERRYADESGWPVKRAQVNGLRSLATKEPRKLAEFAKHQKDKAKRDKETAEAFWNLVLRVLSRSSGNQWSLVSLREQCMPPELRVEPSSCKDHAGPSEVQKRKEREQLRKLWEQQFDQEVIPAFFRTFCIEYLYQMQKRTTGREKNKEDRLIK